MPNITSASANTDEVLARAAKKFERTLERNAGMKRSATVLLNAPQGVFSIIDPMYSSERAFTQEIKRQRDVPRAVNFLKEVMQKNPSIAALGDDNVTKLLRVTHAGLEGKKPTSRIVEKITSMAERLAQKAEKVAQKTGAVIMTEVKPFSRGPQGEATERYLKNLTNIATKSL